MTAKEIALEGCSDALRAGVANLVLVLGKETSGTQTEAAKKKTMERFRSGLTRQKDLYQTAVDTVEELY